MKKNLLLLLSLCTICAAPPLHAQTAASDIADKKQTLYSSVNTPSTPYRIPAIATMSNGEVIAIADYRPCGADVGNGDVDIYARFSADNGVSWSGTNTTYDDTEDVVKIADGGTGTSKGYGDAAVAADPNSGKVVVMCVGGGSTIFSSASTGTSDYLCIRNYSEDYGRTWTQTNVTSYFKGSGNVFGADVASMFFGSGKLAVSKKVSGRIYGALLVRQGKTKLFGSYIAYENKNYAVYSDDWGASWKLLGGGACCTGGDEPKVEELPNGDVLLSSRASGARYFNVFNFTDIASATGSWATATSCSFAGSNSTNGEIMLYQNVYKVGDESGTKYNVVLQSLPTGSSRSNVSVYYKAFEANKGSWAVSDFTSGWAKGIEVDDGASAYSTMTVLPNGQIGFLYEDDYDTSKADGDYSNIVYVSLTVEEITGGQFTATAPAVDPVISIDVESAEMTVGDNLTLVLTTNSDGAVTFTSSDENVATVTDNGVVTALAAGETTITAYVEATSQYNAASVTCTIIVVEDEEDEVTTYIVNPVEGKIGTATYYVATFSAPENTVLPACVKAYYVKSSSDDEVMLARVEAGKAIPAGEGVILIAMYPGEITMTATTDDSDVASLTDNLLVATLEETVVPAGSYVLAKKGSGALAGQFAFCLTKKDLTFSANRAYLRLESDVQFVRMRIEDESTGIGDTQITIQNAESTVIYDLTGRRVTEMLPGRIYIVNGKKIVN